MRTRVLVVGNSHVAAVRNGWKLIGPEFPGFQVKFFAANSTLYQQLEFDDDLTFGIHRPARYDPQQVEFLRKSFRRLTIDMKAFDVVLVVGQNSNEVDFLRQFEGFSIDGVRERPDLPRLSQTAFAEFCDEIARKRLPPAEWHNWDSPKLYFMPVPIPRADCPIDSERYGIWARYGRDADTGLAFLKRYRERVALVYRSIGIQPIDPPDTVYDPCGLTRTEFGNFANKLAGRRMVYEDDDYHHMNAKYGAVVLRHALNSLPAGTQGRATAVFAALLRGLHALRRRVTGQRAARRRIGEAALSLPGAAKLP